MILASDIDQVILDFISAWENAATEILNKSVTPVKNSFNLRERYNLRSHEIFLVTTKIADSNFWANLPLLNRGVNGIFAALEQGHEIHFVSSIPKEFAPQRAQQLKQVFGDHYQRQIFFHVASSPYANFMVAPSKQAILSEIQPEFYADDCWAHCREALEAGVKKVALIDSPHDGDGEPFEHPNLFTSSDLHAALKTQKFID